MANIDKYTNVINKNINKLKITKFKFKNNVNFLNGLAIFLSIVMFVWMFIMLIIVPNSNLSTTYLNVTAFYSAKISTISNSYSLSLTINGIIFIVILILFLTFVIFCILNTKKHFKQLKPYKYRFISTYVLIFYSILFVLFFILILVPPSVGEIANNVYKTNLINNAISDANAQLSISPILNAYKLLGINIPNFTNQNSEEYLNILSSDIVTYIPSNDLKYSLFSFSSNGYVYFNNSIIAIYVLFAFGIFSLVFIFIFKLIYINKSVVAPSITKENIKLIVNAYKQNKKEKKEIRKNKKRLIEEENKLLQNLYEVDLPNSEEQMKKQIEISQSELEEKVSKNNELKKQLEDLIKQKEELKKESLKRSKLKSFVNKLQENNNSKIKNKKHEIAVPDQELEEIFKSLDIE